MEERKKMVLAMEYIARHCNDEDVFWEIWATYGLDDGRIPYGMLEWPEEMHDLYVDDDTVRDLMTCFLRTMVGAWKSGGLTCDGIVSADKSDFRRD